MLLGDGYYVQQLITQQIIDLTGQRSLPGYYDDQQAYMALMNNGIAVGRELKLAPGNPRIPFHCIRATGALL